MDTAQTNPSPEPNKVPGSEVPTNAMPDIGPFMDMAEAKNAIKQQTSTLVQDNSTGGKPQLIEHTPVLTLDFAIEKEQKHGGKKLEGIRRGPRPVSRQVMLESITFQEC